MGEFWELGIRVRDFFGEFWDVRDVFWEFWELGIFWRVLGC